MQKTNFKFEVIIHDDCSTDGTTDVIREYVEKYPDLIKPIFQERNQYQNGCKRILATFVYPKAQGKYIALCEGDDYWTDPLKLQKQVDFLESHPDYSMCFHRAHILKENECDVGLQCDDIDDREYNPNELLEYWKVPTASILARHEVIAVKNIGVERILNGDIIHVLNCAKIGKIRGMSDVMSVYRVQNSGVSYDKKLKSIRSLRYPAHFEFIKDNYPFLKSSIINQKIARAYMNRRKIQTNLGAYLKDVLLAFHYNPLVFLDKFKYPR
jgi:glycosyltransferase involved in cell wall biosynthesis